MKKFLVKCLVVIFIFCPCIIFFACVGTTNAKNELTNDYSNKIYELKFELLDKRGKDIFLIEDLNSLSKEEYILNISDGVDNYGYLIIENTNMLSVTEGDEITIKLFTSFMSDQINFTINSKLVDYEQEFIQDTMLNCYYFSIIVQSNYFIYIEGNFEMLL